MPITWSDDPIGTTAAGFDLIKRTMENADGHGAIPLDVESTNLPAKWVRREFHGTYIGLFNWSSSTTTVQITAVEVRELRTAKMVEEDVEDSLTDTQYPVGDGGTLAIALNGHQTACIFYRLESSRGSKPLRPLVAFPVEELAGHTLNVMKRRPLTGQGEASMKPTLSRAIAKKCVF